MFRRSPATGSEPPVGPVEPPAPARPRWRLYAAAGAALLAVAAVAVVGFALAPGGAPRPSSEREPVTVPSSEPVGPEDAPVADVAPDLLAEFMTVSAALSAEPDADVSALAAVADGAIVQELESERLELTTNEFRKTGTPTVASSEVLESTDTSAVVAACIDSTDVQVVDASGQPVNSAGGLSPRATNIFTLELRDGHWIVVNRTFPNDPTC